MAIPIEYEDYTLSAAGLARAKKAWSKLNMMEYIRENDELTGEPSDYETIPANILESFKRHEYAQYYKDNYEPEVDYLCFQAVGGGGVISMTTQLATAPNIEYSTDKQTWNTWNFTAASSGYAAENLHLESGEKVYMRGTNPNGFYEEVQELKITSFVFTGTVGTIAASGDIGTLVDKVGGASLVLPYGCYFEMFAGCTSLTSAPALPATTLAERCYYQMFKDCTSLTATPTLPATTLANRCYQGMFFGCISLTSAPALPATTLAERCYYQMFNCCTSLTSAPALPATTLEVYCYARMFKDCTSLTAAPTLPATTLADDCYNFMFYGCTGFTSAPALPATTLADECYYGMFYGCTSLTSVRSDLLPSNVTDPTVSGDNPALIEMLVEIGASSLPTELSTIITGLGYTLSDVYTQAS